MANVIADLGDKCTCKISDKDKCSEPKFLRPFDIDKTLIMDYSDMANKGIQDMIDIDELNHATILWNLYKRYCNDDIYTYVGPTLLAVNPFKRMTAKYPPSILEEYHQISNAGDDYYDLMRGMQPHVYAVSAYAHKQMVDNKTR
jgi:myosin V